MSVAAPFIEMSGTHLSGQNAVMSNVTRTLSAIERGDENAADKLLPLILQELHILPAAKLSKEIPGQTLQPTILVDELRKCHDWVSVTECFSVDFTPLILPKSR
jgi:hypothetical protein